MDITSRALTESEKLDLLRPLQNDLIAFYGVLQMAADSLLDKAQREGWTPDQFIDELERLITGDNRAPETTEPIGRDRDIVLTEIHKSLDRLCTLRRVRKASDFSENDHPRDEDGKFFAGSGDKTNEKDDISTRGNDHAGRNRDETESSVSDGRGTHERAVADIRSRGRASYSKRDVDYDSERGPDLKHVEDFNASAGLPPRTRSVKSIFEHESGTVGLELDSEICFQHYHDTLKRLRSSTPMGAQVSLKPAEDYKSMRLFADSDSTAIVAMDGTDMVSVCAEKRSDGSSAAVEMIWQAVGEGAETSDCYGTFLPNYYAKFGFQPVAKLPWSQEAWEEYAAGAKEDLSPDQLDPKKAFATWGGKPDYIFLRLTGDTTPPDLKSVTYVEDWDAGVSAQKEHKE